MKIRQINTPFSWCRKIILFAMRAFIGLFCMLTFGFSSKHGLSQTTVRIDTDTTMTVYQVFGLIKKQTGSTFLYDYDMFKDSPAISLKKGRVKTDDLLIKIRETGNFRYEYTTDKTVIFSRVKTRPSAPPADRQADIQQLRVSGTITDPEGLPLPGVNIVVKGAGHGTMSDENGKYGILVNASDILTFSFVGFKKVEQAVDGREVIDVQLEEDVSALDEVVVNAGYYTVKDRERTGNISRITAEDIEKQPVANPLQALTGRIPGMQIIQQSGVPGGGFTVRIRGQNSIRTEFGVNEPLYIVDGVPFPATPLNANGIANVLPNSVSPLNSIDPSSIASVEVLKDADATAIYGSRGANGVVLITTKKGVPGKSRVDINVSSGAGNVTRKIDLLNTEQYLAMRYEALANDNAEGYLENPAFDVSFPDLKIWDPNRYTDWQKELIGNTAYYNNVQASLSGGNSNTQYIVRGSYFRQTTVYPGDHADSRISGHFNFSHTTPNRKFKTVLTASYTSDDINILSRDLTQEAMRLPPNAPSAYNANRELSWEDWVGIWSLNPLAYLEQEYKGITDNFMTNLKLDYQLLPGLHLSSQLGFTNIQVKEIATIPLNSINPANRSGRTGISNFSDSYIKTWIVEPQITYKKSIGQGELNLLVGGTFQQNIRERESILARGYTSDALLKNLQAAPDITILQSDYTQYRYNAVFGRINYNWKEKYIVNLTGRRDGSSRFGPGNRFANFGAVGAAWIFSNERFLQDSFISFGKLRGSYGTTGSDAIGDYQYLDTYSSTQYPYLGQPGLAPTRLANPDYRWETNKKLEAGLELGLAHDRVFLAGSWYRNRSSNQLVGLPLPVITGKSTIQFNLPATVENKGWEFELNTTNIQSDNFSWRTGFNISFPQNKLLEYQNLEASPFANRYEVGKSLFVFRGFRYLGMDAETGLYTFEDQEGNSTSNPARINDEQFLGEIVQQYYGGFQNSISYKSFELDIFLQFVKQTGRNYIADFVTGPGQIYNYPHIGVMDRWQQPGDISNIQRSTALAGVAATAYNAYRISNASVGNASYIRLSNLSLSWGFPQGLGLAQGSKLYIRGQNLFTITNYKGLDPETRSSLILPPLRMLTLGIQLSF